MHLTKLEIALSAEPPLVTTVEKRAMLAESATNLRSAENRGPHEP